MLQKSIEKEKIKPFYDEWAVLDEEIAEIFNDGKKEAEVSMIQGLAVFKSLLNQCSTEYEKVVPLNHAERLTFIETHRSSYAAFRQLQELFKEMDKKIASKRAMFQQFE